MFPGAIDDQVHFIGNKSHKEIPLWLNSADIFILPSLQEGFGLAVLEAMACGLPVVASRVGGIPEIITNPKLGTLIPPDDAEAIAAAVCSFLENPQSARDVGQNGAEHVRKKFGLKSMVRQLEAVYDEAIGVSCDA